MPIRLTRGIMTVSGVPPSPLLAKGGWKPEIIEKGKNPMDKILTILNKGFTAINFAL